MSLFCTNKCFIVFIGFIYDIHQRERVGRMGAAKTSPNDASHIIWVMHLEPGYVFFITITILTETDTLCRLMEVAGPEKG